MRVEGGVLVAADPTNRVPQILLHSLHNPVADLGLPHHQAEEDVGDPVAEVALLLPFLGFSLRPEALLLRLGPLLSLRRVDPILRPLLHEPALVLLGQVHRPEEVHGLLQSELPLPAEVHAGAREAAAEVLDLLAREDPRKLLLQLPEELNDLPFALPAHRLPLPRLFDHPVHQQVELHVGLPHGVLEGELPVGRLGAALALEPLVHAEEAPEGLGGAAVGEDELFLGGEG